MIEEFKLFSESILLVSQHINEWYYQSLKRVDKN